LELRMGAGEPMKLQPLGPTGGKLKARSLGSSFRALQQRLMRADEIGAQQPAAFYRSRRAARL